MINLTDMFLFLQKVTILIVHYAVTICIMAFFFFLKKAHKVVFLDRKKTLKCL